MAEDENIRFPETSWSRLCPGAAPDADAAERAFRALADAYRTPMIAYLRRARALTIPDAEDLAHEFFLWVRKSGFLAKADPARGPFRGFLKTALRNFVIDEDRKGSAARRGGKARIDSLEAKEVGASLADKRSPEDVFEHAWRAGIFERALSATRDELAAAGQDEIFRLFAEWMLEPEGTFDHAEAATRHGIKPSDVSNRLARTKEKFRTHVKEIVRESVSSAVDLDLELRRLLGGSS